MSSSRLVSFIVAIVYLGAGAATRGAEGFLRMLLFLILPMTCIWFGDEMGAFVSPYSYTKATPGVVVRIGGWILLLATPVALIVMRLVGAGADLR
jgi:hypothetical protein